MSKTYREKQEEYKELPDKEYKKRQKELRDLKKNKRHTPRGDDHEKRGT